MGFAPRSPEANYRSKGKFLSGSATNTALLFCLVQSGRATTRFVPGQTFLHSERSDRTWNFPFFFPFFEAISTSSPLDGCSSFAPDTRRHQTLVEILCPFLQTFFFPFSFSLFFPSFFFSIGKKLAWQETKSFLGRSR